MAEKIAVIKTGGKQYKVKQGDILKIEKLEAKVGDTVKFETLLVSTEDAKDFTVGKPSLGELVEGKILETAKGEKVHVFKYKNKTRYRRNIGHRQIFTEIEISKV